MRILFLTPQLPYPPHQGTAMRNYGLISGLAARHQLSLLSFVEPDQNQVDIEPLTALCQRVELVPCPPRRSLGRRAADTLTRRLPDMGLRLASDAFARRLQTRLAQESFDVIHVEGLEMTPFMDIVCSAQPRPCVVFDEHNCEYALQQRYFNIDVRLPRRWAGALYSFAQWQKLRLYEAAMCRRANHVLAVSQADAQALQSLLPKLAVTVIPNGIDVSAYKFTPSTQAAQPTLVFTGKMDFRPNVDAMLWFADEIWPQVRGQVPLARFIIVGQRPHRRLDRLRTDPSITLTGWVPQTQVYIAEATLYVAPLRMGSGTRLKLLEAMSMGKAIVSTKLGAEGFALQAGKELCLVDDNDPAAFAQAVVSLLRDPQQRARLGSNGRRFVEQHYDWQVIIPRLEKVYAQPVKEG